MGVAPGQEIRDQGSRREIHGSHGVPGCKSGWCAAGWRTLRLLYIYRQKCPAWIEVVVGCGGGFRTAVLVVGEGSRLAIQWRPI